MRLLFDENLSPQLVGRLTDLYPGSQHVRDVGLARGEDEAVWSYAKDNGFFIVSKDADFRQRSFFLAAPPKVIWIRRGNCTTADIEAILRQHHSDLLSFEGETEGTFFALA